MVYLNNHAGAPSSPTCSTCCLPLLPVPCQSPQGTHVLCVWRASSPQMSCTLSVPSLFLTPSVDAGSTAFLNTLGRCRAPKHIHNHTPLARWRAPKVLCATSAGPKNTFPNAKGRYTPLLHPTVPTTSGTITENRVPRLNKLHFHVKTHFFYHPDMVSCLHHSHTKTHPGTHFSGI